MQINGFEQQFARLEPGDHLGMVYQAIDEKMSVVGPFVKEGLVKDGHCIYVADESTVEEVSAALNASNVDVAGKLKQGTLRFLTKWEYRQGKELQPEMMIPVIKSLVDQAMTGGCPALWLAVEMTWTLEPEVDQMQLLRWEAILDALLEGLPAVVLCLYNHNQMAPSALHSALRAHPLMVGSGSVCQNPYYDPPDLILSREALLSKKVDWMLSQIQRFQQQQQALADSERQYRLLAENAKDIVYLQRLAPEVGFEYISPSITDFTGNAPEDFYHNPDLRCQLTRPEDRQLTEVMRVPEPFPESFKEPVLGRWLHKDGTLRWAESNITPIYDEAENLIALEGIVRDVTARRQAEEEIIFQSQIMRHMAEGIVVTRSSDGAIVYTNARFEEMFGYGPGELLGEHISLVNAPGEKSPEEVTRNIIAALNEKGEWRGEVRNIRKNGALFWSFTSISAFQHHEYGKVWILAQTDITERKQAEEERLRLLELAKEDEERQHLKALIDTSPVGVLVVDVPAQQVSLVNPELQRIWGLSYQPGKPWMSVTGA